MKVVLQPGEAVEIEFAESDGQITVEFNAEDLTVKADLPDSEGRCGVVYQEKFGRVVTEDELLAALQAEQKR